MNEFDFINLLFRLGFIQNDKLYELLCDKKKKRKIIVTKDHLFFKVRYKEGLISSNYKQIRLNITERELVDLFSKMTGPNFFKYYHRDNKIKWILNGDKIE